MTEFAGFWGSAGLRHTKAMKTHGPASDVIVPLAHDVMIWGHALADANILSIKDGGEG